MREAWLKGLKMIGSTAEEPETVVAEITRSSPDQTSPEKRAEEATESWAVVMQDLLEVKQAIEELPSVDITVNQFCELMQAIGYLSHTAIGKMHEAIMWKGVADK